MNTTTCDIEALFSQYRLVRYTAGEVLFTSQDTPCGIFYLKKGFVKQYSISEEGRELTVHIFGPQTYFPMTWALGGIPNRHDFQALTHADVFIAPKEVVIKYLQHHPLATLEFSQRLLSGINGLTRRLESIAFGNAAHRIISILLYLSTHFGKKNGKKVIITPRFTHQDIASLTGLSREHVSLELEKLERLGFVHFKNSAISIPDVSLLNTQLARSNK